MKTKHIIQIECTKEELDHLCQALWDEAHELKRSMQYNNKDAIKHRVIADMYMEFNFLRDKMR